MKTMLFKRRKRFVLQIIAAAFLACCAHMPVRVTLDEYRNRDAAFAGQDVILTAPLHDVLERYALYLHKTVEVTAPLAEYSSHGFWTWYLMLEENGGRLRCYTHHYRIEPGWDAVLLLARAKNKKRPVTVLGTLKREGIDIERLTCDNESAVPSFKPPRPAAGWWPYGW